MNVVVITKFRQVFKSADQVCLRIIAVDLQKKMTVVRSIREKVDCNIDAKFNVLFKLVR